MKTSTNQSDTPVESSLGVPSEEKKSKLKRHATKKSTVDSLSDDGKLKSKRHALKEIAETSSDDHKTKRPSRKR